MPEVYQHVRPTSCSNQLPIPPYSSRRGSPSFKATTYSFSVQGAVARFVNKEKCLTDIEDGAGTFSIVKVIEPQIDRTLAKDSGPED